MSRIICVTGAAGFVGSHVVKQLLEKGYHVRGTVRSLSDQTRVAHLKLLEAALPGHLELVEADLLNASSFDSALEGVSCVMHTASPFQIQVADPEADLLRPAVQGTEAVLRSAARHKATVKRVILTSSVAAVHGEYAAPPKSGKLYSESDWNETSSVENGQAYHLSKVLAEKRALELAAEAGLKLIAICPNFVLGPPLSTRVDGLSVGFMKGLLEGDSAPSGTPCICDVRDVARAHVLAAELPADKLDSRYIVSHSAGLNPSKVSSALTSQLPGVKVLPGSDEPTPEKIDGSQLKSLGLELYPMYETVVDMASALIALQIVKLPPAK